MLKQIGLILLVFGLLTLSSVTAKDKITIQITNAADAARKVQVVDVVCGENVVFQERLEPGQMARVRICADDSGYGSIITTLVGGCASAVTSHIENLSSGAEVKL